MKKLLVFILYDSLFKALCYTDSEPKVLDSLSHRMNIIHQRQKERDVQQK